MMYIKGMDARISFESIRFISSSVYFHKSIISYLRAVFIILFRHFEDTKIKKTEDKPFAIELTANLAAASIEIEFNLKWFVMSQKKSV